MFLTTTTVGDAAVTAGLGYAVVFFGLVLLMVVIMVMGKIMSRKQAHADSAAAPAATAAPAAPAAKNDPAPGSAGEVKLHDVSDRDAAMIMAIVADKLCRPLNELRFKSIKEVK